MTVIYFTDGALIDDVGVRRTLVRIPEVIEALKKASDQFIQTDLFLVMSEADVYQLLNFHQKRYLKNILQEALFARWKKRGQSLDLIIKRRDYHSFADLLQVFVKLSTLDKLQVITIGPGFDELESVLRLNKASSLQNLNEFISQDPLLGWFWSDVKNHLELHS